ncbi:glycosyltransferase family 4 protein [Meiothermus ruber]|jgi:glycosyltransferase involved in cell wall biosynthesis
MALMRVLHILEATGGGTARHVADLCLGLVGRGLEVHLAYSSLRMDDIFRKALPVLEKAGIQCYELSMRRAPHPGDIKALSLLNSYITQQKGFDIVHGHSSKAGGIARLLGLWNKVSVVYTPHAFVTLAPSLGGLERLVYGLMERILAYRTDALIAVSKDELAEAHRLGYRSRKTHLIPNGIKLEHDVEGTKGGIRASLSLKQDELVVGFVGRFSQQKSPHLLLEAFAKVASCFPLARLVMVGDGVLKQSLLARADELGLIDRVIWPGFMDGRLAMRAFDVFVLPSNYEGFPYVLLEAMAEGLPVVSTRVGGSEEAIANGENGFIVPVGNVQALSESICKLLEDAEMRRRFGQKSLERVQAFSVDNMVDSTIALYKQLVA